MRTPLILVGALPVLLVDIGCRTTSMRRVEALSAEPAEPATLTSAPGPESPALTAVRMRDHGAHGSAMRDAVARADLDAVRREAKVLAELRIDGSIAPTWRKQLGAMNSAAARVAEAKDLTAASRGLAGVARSCGNCHATFGGPPDPIVGEPPSDGSGVGPRMKRHQWAAARLWDGLVVPSGNAWKAGARVLCDAPLLPELLTPGKSPTPAIGALATAVHDLGRKATVVVATVDRGPVYGELMATCAACHSRVGGGPSEEETK